jgi:hypothetical protein
LSRNATITMACASVASAAIGARTSLDEPEAWSSRFRGLARIESTNLGLTATTETTPKAKGPQRPLTLRHHCGRDMVAASGQIPMAANSRPAS